MLKKIIIVIALILAAFLAAGAFLMFSKSDTAYFLRCHISKAPRMSCDVTLNIDGKPTALNEADVKGLLLDNLTENTVSDFVQEASGCSFRCLGGEYGSQPFEITFRYGDGRQAVIPVRPVVGCCWAISEVKLTIDANSASEIYSYTVTLTVNDEVHTGSGEASLTAKEEIRVSNI